MIIDNFLFSFDCMWTSTHSYLQLAIFYKLIMGQTHTENQTEFLNCLLQACPKLLPLSGRQLLPYLCGRALQIDQHRGIGTAEQVKVKQKGLVPVRDQDKRIILVRMHHIIQNWNTFHAWNIGFIFFIFGSCSVSSNILVRWITLRASLYYRKKLK